MRFCGSFSLNNNELVTGPGRSAEDPEPSVGTLGRGSVRGNPGGYSPLRVEKIAKWVFTPKNHPKIQKNGVVGGFCGKITPQNTHKKCKHLKFDTKSCAKRIDKGIRGHKLKISQKIKRHKSVNTTQK